jgi:hypothetical protein
MERWGKNGRRFKKRKRRKNNIFIYPN